VAGGCIEEIGMSVVGAPRSQGLVARVTGILMRPKTEWELIAGETATPQGLMLGYAALLAALPALATVIHGLTPLCFFLCVTRSPLVVISGALASYLLGLVGVFVLGLIINALAPSFGAEKNQVQAMKVAVYSWTAAWIAGVFVIIPILGPLLSLAGLYSLYLLYLGIERLMKPPADRSIIYTLVVVVIAIVFYAVVAAVVGTVMAVGALTSGLAGTGATIVSPPGQVSGTVHFNGGSVDLGKLQAAGQQLEAQMKAQQNNAPGKVVAVDPEKLKGLLPDSVGGAPRTDVSSTSAGAAGFGASDAEATYASGDMRITIKVTDLAAAGGFAAMAGAMNVQSDHETSTGYEKVSTINGRLTTEKYDNQARSGTYSVIVASRFSVEAEGSGVSMDALKGAVAAVGPDRLEALAHG
jgi:hypothetical protein